MILALFLLQAAPDTAVQARVERVLRRAPVVDGHNDLAWELAKNHGGRIEAVDLNADTSRLGHALQTDVPRLRRGGVTHRRQIRSPVCRKTVAAESIAFYRNFAVRFNRLKPRTKRA